MTPYKLWALAALIVTTFQCASSGYTWTQKSQWPSGTQPEFEPSPKRIGATLGQIAVLPCRVRNLADRVVSWIRNADLHIISSGSFIFTRDPRFSVLHPEGDSSAWGLQLRNVSLQDQGLYECQVNTDPKMKTAVQLDVATGKTMPLHLATQKDDSNAYGGWTRIEGPPERYVRLGSSLSLSCHFRSLAAKTSTTRPRLGLVEWLHEHKILTFGSGRGGVRIDTEKDGTEVTSHLTLASVTHSDAGLYTCRPLMSRPASVLLYVVNGEHSEAMQGHGSLAPGITLPSLALIVLSAVPLIWILR